MKKIIDFPRAKRILDSGKFQPALHSVIGKMTYFDNLQGYWCDDDDILYDRLRSLDLDEQFSNMIEARRDAPSGFEILSPATGEIFALFEDMQMPPKEGWHLGFFAFRDASAFSRWQVELHSWRLPNAREMAELADGV